jgi:NhaP-type Na+/H+ or K+/H+ antiporter
MTYFFTHHPVIRDFLSNCMAQILGGLVSSILVIWFIDHHDKRVTDE